MLKPRAHILWPIALLAAASMLLAVACDDDGGDGDSDTLSDTTSDTTVGDTSTDTSTDTGTDTADDTAEMTLCPPNACNDPARPVCDPASGRCQECVDDTHCEGNPNGNACANGVCVLIECEMDSDCEAGETCQAGRCRPQVVACESPLDCPATAPACVIAQGATMGECEAFSQCTGDDAHEPGSDGPAGALDISADAGASNTVDMLAVCSAPGSESDWFAFTVADGDSVTLTVTPDSATDDLDVEIVGPDLAGIGLSWWQSPEVLELTYLPAGTYYAIVSLYTGDTPQAAAAGYSITLERTAGACASAADCAAAYDTQYLRGECAASGACVPIETAGTGANGAACDSPDDCASDLCTYDVSIELGFGEATFNFFADADTRALCSPQCTADAECSTGTVCSPTLGVCLPACRSNEACPVYYGFLPDPGDAWFHMTCDIASGDCIELEPFVTATAQEVALDEVVVDEVGSHGPGWLAIHEDDGAGAPGALIGAVEVDSGLSAGVVVRLDRPIVDGETLYAMLHLDEGTLGTFEPDTTDVPAVDFNGAVVVASFVVTSPDVPFEPLLAVTTPQTLSDLTSLVAVDEVIAETAAWVVIQEDDGAGTPGTVLGFAAVPMGQTLAIDLELDRPVADQETLYATLHEDLGAVGTFEPGTDVPVINSLGIAVRSTFVAEVPDTTPDVRLSAGANGATGFTFTLVAPAWATDVIGAAADDPTLTLTRGWRYEIDNTVNGSHPLEAGLIDPAGVPTTDVISLSQSSDPLLESDATIGWVEAGNVIAFTVSATFEAAISGYRCVIHTSSMRGGVAYID